MGKKKGKHCSGHHFPRCKSRGGQRTVSIPIRFHQAWHTLFANLNADEVVPFLEAVMFLMERQESVSEEQIEEIRTSLKRR
jgi:RsiW-degrading membrane proteinase PrsW (M82 family)